MPAVYNVVVKKTLVEYHDFHIPDDADVSFFRDEFNTNDQLKYDSSTKELSWGCGHSIQVENYECKVKYSPHSNDNYSLVDYCSDYSDDEEDGEIKPKSNELKE